MPDQTLANSQNYFCVKYLQKKYRVGRLTTICHPIEIMWPQFFVDEHLFLPIGTEVQKQRKKVFQELVPNDDV